jgi:hypothetical protein
LRGDGDGTLFFADVATRQARDGHLHTGNRASSLLRNAESLNKSAMTIELITLKKELIAKIQSLEVEEINVSEYWFGNRLTQVSEWARV